MLLILSQLFTSGRLFTVLLLAAVKWLTSVPDITKRAFTQSIFQNKNYQIAKVWRRYGKGKTREGKGRKGRGGRGGHYYCQSSASNLSSDPWCNLQIATCPPRSQHCRHLHHTPSQGHLSRQVYIKKIYVCVWNIYIFAYRYVAFSVPARVSSLFKV